MTCVHFLLGYLFLTDLCEFLIFKKYFWDAAFSLLGYMCCKTFPQFVICFYLLVVSSDEKKLFYLAEIINFFPLWSADCEHSEILSFPDHKCTLLFFLPKVGKFCFPHLTPNDLKRISFIHLPASTIFLCL